MCNLTDEQNATLQWIADEQNAAAAAQAEKDGTLAPPLKTTTALHKELVDNMLSTFKRDRDTVAKSKLMKRLENATPEEQDKILASLNTP